MAILVVRATVESGQHLVSNLYQSDPLLSATIGVALHPGSINLSVSVAGRSAWISLHPCVEQREDESRDRVGRA
jgi:hypothetical protein